ncbi:MAG: hypothetical protein V3W06_04770 [Acidimicrobiia bacterium]
MKAATALVVLLFASVALNVFLAIDRETTRQTLDEARRHGYVAVEERPGCGWVRVPRCEGCGRFHASPPLRPSGPCTPTLILPGPVADPAIFETHPTLAPPREDFEPERPEPFPNPTFDDTAVDPHESYLRPSEVPRMLWAGL